MAPCNPAAINESHEHDDHNAGHYDDHKAHSQLEVAGHCDPFVLSLTREHLPLVSRDVVGHLPLVSRGVAGHLPLVSRGVVGHLPLVSHGVAGHLPLVSRGVVVWNGGKG